jgi:hypothetical protein
MSAANRLAAAAESGSSMTKLNNIDLGIMTATSVNEGAMGGRLIQVINQQNTEGLIETDISSTVKHRKNMKFNPDATLEKSGGKLHNTLFSSKKGTGFLEDLEPLTKVPR